MNRNISYRNGQVKICNDKACLHASGQQADKIATAAAFSLGLIGIAVAVKIAFS